MPRRRRRKTFARITNRFPFFQLGSSAASHRKRADNSARMIHLHAADSIRMAERGRCREALQHLVGASMAYGGTSCNVISSDTNFPQAAKNAHDAAWTTFRDRCVVRR